MSSISRLLRSDRRDDDGKRDYSIHGILGKLTRLLYIFFLFIENTFPISVCRKNERRNRRGWFYICLLSSFKKYSVCYTFKPFGVFLNAQRPEVLGMKKRNTLLNLFSPLCVSL